MLFLPAQHIGWVGTCRESQEAALLPWGGPHKGVMGGEDDPRVVSLGGLASALSYQRFGGGQAAGCNELQEE